MTAEEIEELIANIEVKLPTALHGLLKRSDGAASLLEQLPGVYTPLAVADEKPAEHNVWDSIGYFYRLQGRYYQATAIYRKLYDHMLAAQEEMHKRCHKGKPLCWICDCYLVLGYGLVFRRFLMLTLVEDAIRDKGSIKAEHSGVPLRAVVLAGFSHVELARYSQRCYEVFQSNESESFYPEWVLQQLDQDWVMPPVPQEVGLFPSNPRYIKHLVYQLGEKSGRVLVPHSLLRRERCVYEGLAQGKLKPRIVRILPLSQVVEAHRYLESNQHVGNVLDTVARPFERSQPGHASTSRAPNDEEVPCTAKNWTQTLNISRNPNWFRK